MRTGSRLVIFMVAGLLCLPAAGLAETQSAPAAATTPVPHHPHKAARKAPPPPLPSGPRGPVPQVPLDAMPAVAPDVRFQDGLLTIVAPNSTLGDVLRAVRKQTSADIEVPSNANERVATRLGPAPPREVMADLLNGSHFNYILLGSPENQSGLVRVVLVAKTGPDTPEAPAQAANNPAPAAPANADNADASETAEETVDETADQAATEAEQTPPDQPGVKTPQQMLQEMQQRQLQMQQQQQNGQTSPPTYPPPGGIAMPQRPPLQPQNPQPQE